MATVSKSEASATKQGNKRAAQATIDAVSAALSGETKPTRNRRRDRVGTSQREAEAKRLSAEILANDKQLAEVVGGYVSDVQTVVSDNVESVLAELGKAHSASVVVGSLRAVAKMGRASLFDMLRVECAFVASLVRIRRAEAVAKSTPDNHDELLRASYAEAKAEAARELGVSESTASRYFAAFALMTRFDWLVGVGQSSKAALKGLIFGVLSPLARYDAVEGAHEFVNPTRAGQDTKPGDKNRRLTDAEAKTVREVVELFAARKATESEAAELLRKGGLKAAGASANNPRTAGKAKGKGKTSSPAKVDFAAIGATASLDNATLFATAFMQANKDKRTAFKDAIIGWLAACKA